MKWAYVLGGLAAMGAAAYFDNVRGPLLPLLSRDLSLSYGEASWFLVAGSFAAVFSNLLLMPLVQRFGERGTTIGVCCLGAVTSLLSYQVGSFTGLMGLAILVGSVLAALGIVSNLLVMRGTPIGARARAMCGLHTMYGLGSLSAPPLLALLIDRGISWRSAFLPGGLLLGALAVFTAFRIAPEARGTISREASKLLNSQYVVLACFCAYVAGEVMVSMWMASFLVAVGFTLDQAAPYLSGFFLMMAATRLLCFLWLPPEWELKVLVGCLPTALSLFWLGHSGLYFALPLVGVFGPFFPLLLARVGRVFHERASSLTIWILTAAQLTLALGHLWVGRLADYFGLERAYLFLPMGLLTLTFLLLLSYLRWERRSAMV